MNESINLKKHWYKTWWGITLIAVFYAILVIALAFGFLIFNYWRLIKAGRGSELMRQFYPQTTQQENADILAIRTALETNDDPFLGNPEAPLVIVAFFDFKCPYCKAQDAVLKQVTAKYAQKVKIIFKDFPVEISYPGTTKLSAIASCAHEQGGYWAFASYFFANQDTLPVDLSSEMIDNMSIEFGVDPAKMRECLASDRGAVEARKDFADGNFYGVSKGTPTYFINGYILAGAVPFENWEAIIKQYDNL
jgi:protein-disulfide isomerase